MIFLLIRMLGDNRAFFLFQDQIEDACSQASREYLILRMGFNDSLHDIEAEVVKYFERLALVGPFLSDQDESLLDLSLKRSLQVTHYVHKVN